MEIKQVGWRTPLNPGVRGFIEVTVLIAKYMDIESRKVGGFEPLSNGLSQKN